MPLFRMATDCALGTQIFDRKKNGSQRTGSRGLDSRVTSRAPSRCLDPHRSPGAGCSAANAPVEFHRCPAKGAHPIRRLRLSPCARISLSARNGLSNMVRYYSANLPCLHESATCHRGHGSAAPPFSLKRLCETRVRSRIAICWCCAPPLTAWPGFQGRGIPKPVFPLLRDTILTPGLSGLRPDTRSSHSAGLFVTGSSRLSYPPTRPA